MSHGHDHGHAARNAHIRPLTIAFVLVAIFMVVEFIGAFVSGSLALLSDAGHMATDALGLGMALAAMVAAGRPTERPHQTYGLYRVEILAALANAILLIGVGVYVLYEASQRFTDPPAVLPVSMLVVATAGLVVNIIGWRLLRAGAKESLNVEGAYLKVLADLIGSIAVVVAAVMIQLTGWAIIDPILGAVIGLFIVPRAVRLGWKSVRILSQMAPAHLDMGMLTDQLAAIDGVIDVHDLHVWTLTSDMEVASVHLMTRQDVDAHRVLDEAKAILDIEYGIDHATLQVEPETHAECAEVSW